jgi:hypothetical protein
MAVPNMVAERIAIGGKQFERFAVADSVGHRERRECPFRTIVATCGLILALALSVAAEAQTATLVEAETAALTAAKIHVPKAMKNPKSAEFDEDTIDSAPLVGWGDGTAVWRRVEGVVRGTNSFGGVVPNDWTAYVAEIDGQLTVEAIMLEDKFIHSGPLGDVVLEEFKRVLAEAQEERDQERQKRQAETNERMKKINEEERIARVKRQGKETGFAMANAMGYAKMRLTDKEAQRRGKKYAQKAKLDDEETELFVEGFVSGVAAAKEGGQKRN